MAPLGFQMGDSREELCLAPLSDIKQKVYYYGLTSEEIGNPGLMTGDKRTTKPAKRNRV